MAPPPLRRLVGCRGNRCRRPFFWGLQRRKTSTRSSGEKSDGVIVWDRSYFGGGIFQDDAVEGFRPFRVADLFLTMEMVDYRNVTDFCHPLEYFKYFYIGPSKET